MREITTHHDGHGLAESMLVTADEIGPGGASHHYHATIGTLAEASHVLDVQFQKGPRNEVGSVPGVIDSVLLAIVRDRLECFQKGPFPSVEGLAALLAVEHAMACFKRRADERAERGVLGKAEP